MRKDSARMKPLARIHELDAAGGRSESADSSPDRSPREAFRASVVICTGADERWSGTREAVESIGRQTLEPLEMFVVVNHNPQLLARARHELADASVLENRGPPGLFAARNTGIAHSVGDIVAFLGDDTIATPHWLEQLVGGYRFHSVVGVGGSIVPIWPGPRPRHLPRELDWVLGYAYDGFPATAGRVRTLMGANMSFRRAALLSIGGFRACDGQDGRYAATVEEIDACIRLARATPNGLLLYDPGAVVHQRFARDRADLRSLSARCYAQGRLKARLSAELQCARGGAGKQTTRRTFPRELTAVLRSVLRRDASALGRAGIIALGRFMTATGYFAERSSNVCAGLNGCLASGKWKPAIESETPSE
jgi:GT2 family glycosyltransferase